MDLFKIASKVTTAMYKDAEGDAAAAKWIETEDGQAVFDAIKGKWTEWAFEKYEEWDEESVDDKGEEKVIKSCIEDSFELVVENILECAYPPGLAHSVLAKQEKELTAALLPFKEDMVDLLNERVERSMPPPRVRMDAGRTGSRIAAKPSKLNDPVWAKAAEIWTSTNDGKQVFKAIRDSLVTMCMMHVEEHMDEDYDPEYDLQSSVETCMDRAVNSIAGRAWPEADDSEFETKESELKTALEPFTKELIDEVGDVPNNAYEI
jgi:hypothetical protein